MSVSENHLLPLVAGRLLFPLPADDVVTVRQGALAARLFAEGAAHTDARAIADRIAACGGQLQFESDDSKLAVQFSVLPDSLPALLAVVAEVVRAPAFSTDAVARAQDASPLETWPTLRARLFGSGHATQARMSAESLQSFHRRIMRPERGALVLVGDVAFATALSLARDAFDEWAVPAPSGEATDSTPPPARRLFNADGAQYAQIAIGQHIIAPSHPDHLALVLLAAVLRGEGESSLSRRMGSEALELGVTLAPSRERSTFMVRATVPLAQAPRSVAELQAAVEALRREAVSARELTAVKGAFIEAFPAYFQTREAVARLLGRLFLQGLPAEHYRQLPDRLEAITPRDLQAAARRHLDPEALERVVIGDVSVIEEPLRALGLGEWVVQEEP